MTQRSVTKGNYWIFSRKITERVKEKYCTVLTKDANGLIVEYEVSLPVVVGWPMIGNFLSVFAQPTNYKATIKILWIFFIIT